LLPSGPHLETGLLGSPEVKHFKDFLFAGTRVSLKCQITSDLLLIAVIAESARLRTESDRAHADAAREPVCFPDRQQDMREHFRQAAGFANGGRFTGARLINPGKLETVTK